MFGKRWRTRHEVWYIVKHNLHNSFPLIIISIWSGFMLVAGLYVRQTWENDFPNWFALMLSVYFGVLVAMIAYFKAKKSQDNIESRIIRIEGILSSEFKLEKNHPKTSQFYLSLSLDGIINVFPDLEKLAKKWKRSKNVEEKNFLEEKINHIWKNTMVEYGGVLQNPDYVSDKLYDKKTLNALKDIYINCNIFPLFDYDENKINFHKFHRIVGYCILLFDKLKIDSKFRTDLLKY